MLFLVCVGELMVITVKLYGVLRIGRFKEMRRVLPEGSRVRDVVDALDLPPALLGIVLINGVHADVGQPLEDGDSLSLLPLLEGG